MKHVIGLLTASTLALTGPILANGLDYPEARRGAQVDVYHGVEVTDPYRWLEDLEAAETRAWMASQESLLTSYLDRDRVAYLERRIVALGETGATTSVPTFAGRRYFYTVREPQQRLAVIFARRDPEGGETVVLDPNDLLAESQRLGGFSLSPAGRYLVYRVVENGTRWGDLKIFDLETGATLGETIDGVAGATTVWKPDESGFYYVDYGRTESLKSGGSDAVARVRFHPVGGEADADAVVFPRRSPGGTQADTAPGALFSLARSGDGRYLALAVYEGSADVNRLFYADLTAGVPDFVELATDGEHAYQFLGSSDDRFYLYTNHSAPNGRIVALDRRSERAPSERWTEVVAESDDVLAGGSSVGGNAMTLVGDRLVLLYRRANLAVIRVFSLGGRLEHEIPLAAGWIGSGLVADDAMPGEVWYSFNGFVEPSTVYRLDLETGKARRAGRRGLPIDPADYLLEHVFYPSSDGTRVPLFVARKHGVRRDGSSPVFMYGYGFGGWVAVPWYQPHILAWLEMGGTFAMPGIRGGGEYGDAWRDAGIRLNRQTAIDDYVAAAEWLIAERYTSAGKVVANGWSASGSLAAAAVQQRPELFGAALIGIPSLDMLRYHHFTALPGWTRGYGSSEDPEEFKVLYGYSPYHQAQGDGRCTPPTLVTVGEKDEVTPPLHGYKFVAALQHQRRRAGGAQEAVQCASPALLKIVRGAGHGFGTTPEQSRRTYAEELSFLAQALGLK